MFAQRPASDFYSRRSGECLLALFRKNLISADIPTITGLPQFKSALHCICPSGRIQWIWLAPDGAADILQLIVAANILRHHKVQIVLLCTLQAAAAEY